MNYQYFSPIAGYEDNNSLGLHPSVSVVLGWYPIKKFKSQFDETYYAVCGNLYDGVNGGKKFITNLLYNPHIKHVVLCDITKEDKFNNPAAKVYEMLSNWIVDDTPLLDHISLYLVSSFEDLRTLLETLKTQTDISNRPKVELPVERIETKVYPAYPIGQTYHVPTVKQAHLEMLKRIRQTGVLEDNLQELLSLSVTIDDEFTNLSWLDTQPQATKEYCLSYIYGSDSDHSYGYGDRLIKHFAFNQIDNIIDKLSKEIGSKSCVFTLFEPQDLIRGKSPCLTQIWIRIRANQLFLIGIFRSNDMYRAYPLNAYALRTLQVYLADRLNVQAGSLTTISFSAHIYEDNFKEIDELLLKYEPTNKLRLDYIGNFVITKTDGLFVTHLSDNGEFLCEYTGNVTKIIRQIIFNNPSISTEHVAYLSRELTLFELLPNYVQDSNYKKHMAPK
jgi:thymidylate synthase